jgi:hypothetical protein
MTRSLHDGLIQRALDRIRAGDKADAAPAPSSSTGSNWSSAIPGLRPYRTDRYHVGGGAVGSDKGGRMSRLLKESFLRFRYRLASARPSDRALQMGLS